MSKNFRAFFRSNCRMPVSFFVVSLLSSNLHLVLTMVIGNPHFLSDSFDAIVCCQQIEINVSIVFSTKRKCVSNAQNTCINFSEQMNWRRRERITLQTRYWVGSDPFSRSIEKDNKVSLCHALASNLPSPPPRTNSKSLSKKPESALEMPRFDRRKTGGIFFYFL